MLNIRRTIWIYEHCGMACAIKCVCYDLIAILIFIGYCLTLPFRFVWILCRGSKNGKL